MFASGYQADLDVNMDGAVDSKDSGVVSKLRGRSLGAGELSDRGNIVGWCGYLYEEATGMWLARHRWQIPELGRWANRDPIGYAGGGQNLYEYVNGNPVFLQDSMGLSDENPDYDNIAHLRAYEDEETGQRMQASPCWSSLRGILEDQRDGESMEDCAKRVEGSKKTFKRWECQKELAEDAPGIPWNDLLTDPHVVLGVLGMTPGFGIAADLVDAGLYLSEGKFAEAGWSLVAAVPFVGDAIAAGRLGSRVSKVVKATGNAVNRAMPPQFAYLTSTVAKATTAAVRSKSSRTEVVQRAMSRSEYEHMRRTNLLTRTGPDGRRYPGDHFVSPAISMDAKRARQRLALPGWPEVRVTLEVPRGVFSVPRRVQPYRVRDGILPGGGIERIAPGHLDIPVKIINVDLY